MRRRLGTLLPALVPALLLLVAGCGGGTAGEPAPSGREPAYREVALLSHTAAGGQVRTAATVLADERAVREYAEQFSSRALRAELTRTAERTDVPAGRALVAAVVDLGCVPLAGISVDTSGNEVVIRGKRAHTDPRPECLAPVTTVALVLVDAE